MLGGREVSGLSLECVHVVSLPSLHQAASAVYAWTGTLYIVIYGERLNLRNFWSGSWLSVWEIKDGDISGTIKVRFFPPSTHESAEPLMPHAAHTDPRALF